MICRGSHRLIHIEETDNISSIKDTLMIFRGSHRLITCRVPTNDISSIKDIP